MNIDQIRPSIGTAILLGLREGDLPAPPTTAYLMVGEGCSNDCGFCTQARSASSSGDLLSRVTWPSFKTVEVLGSMANARKKGIGRLCLQVLSDPAIEDSISDLVSRLREASDGLPISISMSIRDEKALSKIKDAGADRIGIALDVGSRDLFESIKGRNAGNPFDWDEIWQGFQKALSIFGRGRVSTHMIIGMGETDSEVLDVMRRCRELGVLVSLFAYTPMKGTRMTFERPSLNRYRAIQMMRHLVMEKGIDDGFLFNDQGALIGLPDVEITSRNWIATSGCPECNRPYYNERPSGPMYNYPVEPPEGALRDAYELVDLYIDRNRAL